MSIKVIFIGNSLDGDDGIGPLLYQEMKDDKRLENLKLMELGIIGFDLVTYVENDDQLIIVDALKSKNDEIGTIKILKEKDIKNNKNLVSPHDFGISETVSVLRSYYKDLKTINIIGITIKDINPYSEKLTTELEEKIPDLKEQVIKEIIRLSGE